MTDSHAFELSTEQYRLMLKDSLRYVNFDKIDRTLFSFESIFHPLSVNEGKYAFLSYMEQMATAGGLSTDGEEELPEDMTHDRGKRDAVLSIENSYLTKAPIVNQELTPDASFDAIIQPTESKNDELSMTVNFHETSMVQRELNRRLYADPVEEESKFVRVSESFLPLGDEDELDDIDADLGYLRIDDADDLADDTKPMAEVERNTNQKMLDAIHDKWSFDIGDGDTNLLLIEPTPALRHCLCIPSDQGYNRLLLIASAGHGKSTFLRRLALYYCDENTTSVANQELQNIYALGQGKTPIPCLVYLRNIDETQMCDEQVLKIALKNSVMGVVWTGLQASLDKGERQSLPSQQQVMEAVEAWLNHNADQLIILMDGLDELAESKRRQLLCSMESFLKEHPHVPIMLTSRVAGLLESATEEESAETAKAGIMSHLKRMHFRGRSIIPLNDKSAEAYGIRWIQVTQPEPQQALLREALRKVQTQRKFAYLKTFMRTPLELLTVLKQLSQDHISLNRCAMFHEMLWQLITNHVKENISKQALFDDTMTLLSFIAYHMQMKERLYLTREELFALEDDFANLILYTEIVGEDYAEMPKVLSYLDDLAANVGIIERDERTDVVSYTFPIRSYQEFLCAYACTHLVLEEGVTPVALLQKHLDNNHWWGIVVFAISDLQENNRDAFDILIKAIFTRTAQDELVKVVLESNPTLTTEQATLFCEQFFDTPTLSLEQRDLIMACMATKSAYVYPYAISALHQRRMDIDPTAYTEVLSRMSVIQLLRSPHATPDKLYEDLTEGTPHAKYVAVCMVYMLAASAVGLSLRPYMRQAREFLAQSDKWEALLCQAVNEADDHIATYGVRALTLLRVSFGGGTPLTEDFECEMRYRLYDAIDATYTLLRETISQGEDAGGLSGIIVTLTDDLYVLGVLDKAVAGEALPSNVLYKDMIYQGCKRVGLLAEPLGYYIQNI